MIERSTDGHVITVVFRLDDTSVGPLGVAGDFNGWNQTATPMQPDGTGMVATVVLEAGRRYRFRYHDGNGRWFNDSDADDYEPNDFGGYDGVLVT